MTEPKLFEVVARSDPDEDGKYHVRAGVGCLVLSIGWFTVALVIAVAFLLRAIR